MNVAEGTCVEKGRVGIPPVAIAVSALAGMWHFLSLQVNVVIKKQYDIANLFYHACIF